MARRLKVFRTTIGFHDAYVAAPSRRAALEIWGTDKNLFATEAAEEVTDPELMAEPLEHPGEVIRKTRGSLADQLKAAGPVQHATAALGKKQARRRSPPSRSQLEKAEKALEEFDQRAGSCLAELQERERALAEERARIEASLKTRREKLEARRVREDAAFRAKWARWDAEQA